MNLTSKKVARLKKLNIRYLWLVSERLRRDARPRTYNCPSEPVPVTHDTVPPLSFSLRRLLAKGSRPCTCTCSCTDNKCIYQ